LTILAIIKENHYNASNKFKFLELHLYAESYQAEATTTRQQQQAILIKEEKDHITMK